METSIYIIVFLSFLVLSLRSLTLGIGAIIVLLPTYLWRFEFFLLPTTFLELMILALFLIWLIKDKVYKRINFSFEKNQDNRVPLAGRYLLSLWLLASIVSLLVNPSLSSLGLWRAYFLEPMMFFLLIIYNIKDKKDLKIIINSLAILVLWLLVVTVYQNFSSWNYLAPYNPPNIKRLTGVFSYPNALSLLTAPLAGFFIAYFLSLKDKKNNYFYLLASLASVLLAFLAFSQGAMLAIFISLLIYLILAKKTRKLSSIILTIVFMLSFIVLPLSLEIKQIKQELFNPELDLAASSLEIRSSQWQETALMLKDNFIFGSGLNAYQKTMEKYHQNDWLEIYLYPHNIFLNFWVELGLLGLVVFVALLVFIAISLRNLFKDKNILAWPLSLAWLIWFIHGLVDVPYFKNDLSILFFIFLALTISASTKNLEPSTYKN